MDQKNFQEGRIDAVATRLLDELGQRASRRGILAGLGRLTLTLMGISVLPNLPLDRSFTPLAQTTGDCAGDNLCGICGKLCPYNCCPNGADGCPNCLRMGALYWSKCCRIYTDLGGKILMSGSELGTMIAAVTLRKLLPVKANNALETAEPILTYGAEAHRGRT